MKSIELKPRDLRKVKLLCLQHQGLTQTSPFGRGRPGARSALQHLGYVQLDTISVVERAHHHALYSRVPNYKPEQLNKLLKAAEIFEYWSHAAAVLPIEDYRFTLPYKHRVRSGKVHWFKNPDRKLMARLLKQIESEGGLSSRSVTDERQTAGGWWEWKPAKRALEQLYFEGRLMVRERVGFDKVYDLPERVLPAGLDISLPSFEVYADFLLQQQLKCHGMATLKGLTYQRRDPGLRKAMKARVEQGLETDELAVLTLPTGTKYLAKQGFLEQRQPRMDHRLRILSPFDNAVIQRERLNELFGFDYQIECYLPEHKRKYGYFCLPLLWRDQLIGRMDCKARRADGTLLVFTLHFEEMAEDPHLFQALGDALADFARFQGCTKVTLQSGVPRKVRSELNRVLAAIELS